MYYQEEIVAVSAVRTPFGRFGGSLKYWDIYDMSAKVMEESVKKIGLDYKLVDEVWWGNGDTTNTKDPFTPVVARQALLKAGFPPTTPSVTFDKACVSGMSAINYGIGRIILGEAEIILGGGSTSFSTVPYLARNLRWNGVKAGGIHLDDPIIPLGYEDYAPVAVDSGNVAEVYNVSREDQDKLAYESHKKYGEAIKSGFYNDHMLSVEYDHGNGKYKETFTLNYDEQYRENTSIEKLSKLSPVFNNPSITAGNSPGLNDGAAALIVMKKNKAEELELKPLFSILQTCTIAAKPSHLPVAPALAIKKALDESNLTLKEIDVLEINEAFAAVPLVSIKLLACEDFLKESYEEVVKKIDNYPLTSFNQEVYDGLLNILNKNGGAIAIGHANTASGTRIMMNAAKTLQQQGGGIAIAAICGGLTQGDACVIKV